jgi:hypothetical protein
VRRGRTITVVGGGCERRSSSRTQRRSQSRGLLPPPSPSPSPLTAVRASKSIESAVVPALPATERTKRHGRARRVCCWRFVRLEADGGYEAEQDHTPRVYTHTHTHTRARARARVVPPLRRTSGTSRGTIPLFLLSASSAPLFSAVPPDSFFHARLRLRLYLAPSLGLVFLLADRSCRFPRRTAELFIAHVPGYRNPRTILLPRALPPRGGRGAKMNNARAIRVCETC